MLPFDNLRFTLHKISIYLLFSSHFNVSVLLVRETASGSVTNSNISQQHTSEGKKGTTTAHNSNDTKITRNHEHYPTTNCYQRNSHIHRVTERVAR